MYRSYSYKNMPQPIIRREPSPAQPPPQSAPEPKETVQRAAPAQKKPEGLGGLLQNIQTDDIILIVVIFALLLDDCDDKLLLLALGFIFFSDLF